MSAKKSMPENDWQHSRPRSTKKEIVKNMEDNFMEVIEQLAKKHSFITQTVSGCPSKLWFDSEQKS